MKSNLRVDGLGGRAKGKSEERTVSQTRSPPKSGVPSQSKAADRKPERDHLFRQVKNVGSSEHTSEMRSDKHSCSADSAEEPSTAQRCWLDSTKKMEIEKAAQKTAKETGEKIRSEVIGEALESLQEIRPRVEAILNEAVEANVWKDDPSKTILDTEQRKLEMHRICQATTPDDLYEVKFHTLERNEVSSAIMANHDAQRSESCSSSFDTFSLAVPPSVTIAQTDVTMVQLVEELSRVPKVVEERSAHALNKMQDVIGPAGISTPQESVLIVAEDAGKAAKQKIDQVLHRIGAINADVQNGAVADAFVRAKVRSLDRGRRSKRLAIRDKLVYSGLSDTVASSDIVSPLHDWTDAPEYVAHKKTRVIMKRMDRILESCISDAEEGIGEEEGEPRSNPDEHILYGGSMSKRKLGDHHQFGESDDSIYRDTPTPSQYANFADWQEEVGTPREVLPRTLSSTDDHNDSTSLQAPASSDLSESISSPVQFRVTTLTSGPSWADLSEECNADDDWGFMSVDPAQSQSICSIVGNKSQSVLACSAGSSADRRADKEVSAKPCEAALPRRAFSECDMNVLTSRGSKGHPDFCSRACLYFWRGDCRNGVQCPFCHNPHPKRPPRLDKRHRQIMDKLSYKRVYNMMMPVVLAKCQKYPGLETNVRALLQTIQFDAVTEMSDREKRMKGVISAMHLGYIVQFFTRLGSKKLSGSARAHFAGVMDLISSFVSETSIADGRGVRQQQTFQRANSF